MNGLLLALGLGASVRAQTVAIPASDDPVEFALDLYKRAAAEKPGRNVLVSPYSAREALGLAYVGARGATRDGLAKALRAGRPADFMEAAKSTRASLLAADPKTTIEVANSLWLREDWKFLNSYVAKAKGGFAAEVFRRRFGPDTAAETGRWVSEKTHGKITKAVEKLAPLDVAVLLDAVYFKGVWRTPFDRSRTEPEDFRLASGKTVKRPRMRFSAEPPEEESREFDYAERPDLQAVRLPYGSGRLAMIVVLPSSGTTLGALTAKLDETWWKNLHMDMANREGEVELPRFAFDDTLDLNAPVAAMGAARAFQRGRADFRDMAEARKPEEMLFISKAEQAALVEVDEEGTVAAAKTSAVMHMAGATMREHIPFTFVADRPFLFVIEDSTTGTLLFIGGVQDPGTKD